MAMLHERIERKRRRSPQQPLTVTRNWSTMGFFECSPTIEQLQELSELPQVSPPHRGINTAFITQPLPKTAPTATQSPQRSRRPMTGDVYFRKQQDLTHRSTFEVSEIDERASQAIDKTGFAVPLADLEDVKYFDRAMEGIVGLHDAPRPKTAPNLVIPPLAKYAGLPARMDFFQLYKYYRPSQETKKPTQNNNYSPLTARVEFVKLCQEQQLPPVPFLTRCTSGESPSLNLSGQGISPFYIKPLSKSFEKIDFLKQVDLSNNQLDETATVELLVALQQKSQLVSLTLDRNRIGAKGVTELIAMISAPQCQLSELSVAEAYLSDAQLASLMNACLSITQTLTKLNVKGNEGSSKTANSSARLLQCDDLQLVELNMSWNTLRTQGANTLFQTLAKYPLAARIHRLVLSWNGVADGIAKALFSVLATEAVDVLYLDHNRITDLTLRSLLQQQLQSKPQSETTPQMGIVFNSNLCSDAVLLEVENMLHSKTNPP